jgi:hypothetical protein
VTFCNNGTFYGERLLVPRPTPKQEDHPQLTVRDILFNIFAAIYLKAAEETKYMLLSRQQNAGQNHDIKIATKFFENVAQFKYLGMTIKIKI